MKTAIALLAAVSMALPAHADWCDRALSRLMSPVSTGQGPSASAAHETPQPAPRFSKIRRLVTAVDFGLAALAGTLAYVSPEKGRPAALGLAMVIAWRVFTKWRQRAAGHGTRGQESPNASAPPSAGPAVIALSLGGLAAAVTANPTVGAAPSAIVVTDTIRVEAELASTSEMWALRPKRAFPAVPESGRALVPTNAPGAPAPVFGSEAITSPSESSALRLERARPTNAWDARSSNAVEGDAGRASTRARAVSHEALGKAMALASATGAAVVIGLLNRASPDQAAPTGSRALDAFIDRYVVTDHDYVVSHDLPGAPAVPMRIRWPSRSISGSGPRSEHDALQSEGNVGSKVDIIDVEFDIVVRTDRMRLASTGDDTLDLVDVRSVVLVPRRASEGGGDVTVFEDASQRDRSSESVSRALTAKNGTAVSSVSGAVGHPNLWLDERALFDLLAGGDDSPEAAERLARGVIVVAVVDRAAEMDAVLVGSHAPSREIVQGLLEIPLRLTSRSKSLAPEETVDHRVATKSERSADQSVSRSGGARKFHGRIVDAEYELVEPGHRLAPPLENPEPSPRTSDPQATRRLTDQRDRTIHPWIAPADPASLAHDVAREALERAFGSALVPLSQDTNIATESTGRDVPRITHTPEFRVPFTSPTSPLLPFEFASPDAIANAPADSPTSLDRDERLRSAGPDLRPNSKPPFFSLSRPDDTSVTGARSTVHEDSSQSSVATDTGSTLDEDSHGRSEGAISSVDATERDDASEKIFADIIVQGAQNDASNESVTPSAAPAPASLNESGTYASTDSSLGHEEPSSAVSPSKPRVWSRVATALLAALFGTVVVDRTPTPVEVVQAREASPSDLARTISEPRRTDPTVVVEPTAPAPGAKADARIEAITTPQHRSRAGESSIARETMPVDSAASAGPGGEARVARPVETRTASPTDQTMSAPRSVTGDSSARPERHANLDDVKTEQPVLSEAARPGDRTTLETGASFSLTPPSVSATAPSETHSPEAPGTDASAKLGATDEVLGGLRPALEKEPSSQPDETVAARLRPVDSPTTSTAPNSDVKTDLGVPLPYVFTPAANFEASTTAAKAMPDAREIAVPPTLFAYDRPGAPTIETSPAVPGRADVVYSADASSWLAQHPDASDVLAEMIGHGITTGKRPGIQRRKVRALKYSGQIFAVRLDAKMRAGLIRRNDVWQVLFVVPRDAFDARARTLHPLAD